jgi:hypothetical protein
MEFMITHPSLDEYHARLVAMAEKYGYEGEDWISLKQSQLSRQEWFEYSFIVSTVGDLLIQREFDDTFQAPSHVGPNDCTSTEPGANPGLVFLAGVNSECREVCETY